MSQEFQTTRFQLFCKLTGTGGKISDYVKEVEAEATLQRDIASGEKEITSLYTGVTRMTINREIVRHVVKVHIDEHQYKSITVSENMCAKQVCAIGAKKFGLDSWSYSLVARKGSELLPLNDDEYPCQVIDACVGEGITDLTFFFVAPRLNSDNKNMRFRAVTTYLNHYLGAWIAPIEDLARDLSDGVIIARYVEYLLDVVCDGAIENVRRVFTSHQKNVAVHSNPSSTTEREENLRAAFKALADAGVRLNGDPVSQIVNGDKDAICAVVWNILFRYCTVRNTLNWDKALERYASDPNEFVFLEAVMAWCKRLASNYPNVVIANYCTSWQDGIALAAMLEMTDNYVASAHRLHSMPDAKDRLATAIDMAHGIYNVPPLITADDFDDPSTVDEWTMTLYVTVLATELNKKLQQRFARQALVNLAKLKAEESGESSGGSLVLEGPQLIKVFFEGNPDFDSKIFKITPGVSSDEFREMIANKLHCDPNGFWIFQQENNAERNVGAGELLFTDPEHQVVTIKFVAGSHYYTGEYKKPVVQQFVGSAVKSPRKDTKAPRKSSSAKKPDDQLLKAKKKSWRSSLSFGKKKT